MVDEKTKVKIEVIDKQTKEPIPGIKVEIIDKETGETVYEFESGEEPKIIEGLPIGDYEIKTTDPEDRGYVTETTEIKIEDTKEEQEIKIELDYTKIKISLEDKDTEEPIKEGKLEIIDKNGKVVQEIETKDGRVEIEKLPPGEYTIHQTEAPKGYHKAEDVKIEIKNTGKWQEFKIKNKKMVYNMAVEKSLTEIILNGESVKITDPKLAKLEIKTTQIKKTSIIAKYNIRVSNKGEVEGTAKVLEKIPEGYDVVWENDDVGASFGRPEAWKVRADGTLEADIYLKPGESKDLKISLKWVNKEINLGSRANMAKIENTDNKLGIEDMNKEDDISEATIIINIKTGVVVNVIIILLTISIIIICILVLICNIFVKFQKIVKRIKNIIDKPYGSMVYYKSKIVYLRIHKQCKL